MVKITIEVEVDVDAYNAEYGAGGPWSREHDIPGGLDPATEETVKAQIKDALDESFYDYGKDNRSWFKLTFKD